jgi:hypothetical protein
LVEQRIENPRVGGSIPPQATKESSKRNNDLDNKATVEVAFCFLAQRVEPLAEAVLS